MKYRGIIGYTGTIGKNLLNQKYFSYLYNSSNLKQIKNQNFEELYLTCLPATKWLINKESEKDDNNTQEIINILKTVKSNFVVLISTIDVYTIKNNKMTEDDIIDNHKNDTYGKNRYLFEKFVINNFDNYLIVRLPGVFGDYLKKNVLYDLINNNNIEKICLNSKFQYYFLDNLSDDIQKYRNMNIKIINLFTQPLSNKEIIDTYFIDKINIPTNQNILEYDICTKYSDNGYLYSKKQIIEQIGVFLKRINMNKDIEKLSNNIIYSNIAWNDEETEQVLNMFVEHKIKKIELALTKYYNWDEINEQKLNNIKKIFHEKDIKIYSLQAITYGLDYNLFSPTRNKLMNHLINIIKYAHILEAKIIVFGSPKNRSYNNNYDEEIALNFFRELNETAKKYDIIFCIEPNARVYNCNFLWNLKQTYDFVKKLNCSHIKMMADTGCMSFENDDIYSINEFKDMIEHIHLSEQYLDILSNKNINHSKICEILINSNKKHFTIEVKAEKENISRIYKTILFIKENYKNIILNVNE
jgi:sugar phosphate isomerase/epimerase